MIDFALKADARTTLDAWIRAHGLAREDGRALDGFAFCWWNQGAADEGRVMSVQPTFDAAGEITAPPQYLAGFWLLVRILSTATDNLTPAANNPDRANPWARSVFARQFVTNGSPVNLSLPGKPDPIKGREWDGVQIYRIKNRSDAVTSANGQDDLTDYLTARGLPVHEWAGGNIT